VDIEEEINQNLLEGERVVFLKEEEAEDMEETEMMKNLK
jgi:hypothetical protein